MAKSKNRKNSQLPLIIGAAVIACAAIAALAFGGGSGGAAAENAEFQIVGVGESAVIPTDSVTESASFYPIEVDGAAMELLAIRDTDGNIRTAFNTCQSCYDSGAGYYEADGTDLVCQNCGFRFTAEQVETEGGGCNPYPIFEQDKTVTDDAIEIGYDFLKSSAGIFENWKR